METKKSKKTRSYGESTKSSNPARSSLSPTPSPRPSHKERVKSAPQIPQAAQQQRLSSQPHASSKRGSHTSEPGPGALSPPSSPIHHKSTVSSVRSSGQSQTGGHGRVNEVVIAVLGADAVGKSTFVHLALDLKKAATSPISSKKVSLEGSISIVRLVEVDIEDVGVEEESLLWPELAGDQVIPAIDGVLVMYNVLDPNSISPLPPLLDALSTDGVPTIVVASNCDQPPKTWRVDHGKVEKLCSRFEGVECFQTSISVSETHKRCVSIILRNVMLERQGPFKTKRILRPRAVTSTQSMSPSRHVRSAGNRSKHGRAASEVPSSMAKAAGFQNSDLPVTPTTPRGTQEMMDEDSQETRLWSSPPADSDSTSDATSLSENSDSDNEPIMGHSNTSREPAFTTADLDSSLPGVRNSAANSLHSDETIDSDHMLAKQNLVADPESLARNTGEDDDDSKESGITFDDLVNRLLSQPMSKSDSKFAAIFLCFYRKFAAPSELLLAFVQRFEEMNASELPDLIRLNAQLRHLTILKDWVSDYPGDFAHPLTRRIIANFVQGLGNSQIFAVAHKEIGGHLDIISEDDDTEWACSDRSRSRSSTMESFLTMSSAHGAVSTVTADTSTEDIMEQSATLEKVPTRGSARVSSTPSTASSADKSASQSTLSFQTSLNVAENAQRQAQLLTPIPRIMLDKIRWHQMMEIPEEHIARELTRIDWIMYSSIRPRDLVRHISLTNDQKERCRSLEHVNRMINQFNHIAFWVANLILLRDKPKHRAKALEKFMGVAWKLRHLNNYNSLGAVIAGINGTAVHRLAQTRELVSPEAQKQFMRLEILMGTQRSHFAYRLAWENTSTARIPFLPLHRRDLVMTEEANPTFIAGAEGELINWKKFEIMGQVIIEIRKSQQMAYLPIKRHEEVQRLVLDGTFPKDDDELYERSIQLERPGAGENPRKKFNWFQR